MADQQIDLSGLPDDEEPDKKKKEIDLSKLPDANQSDGLNKVLDSFDPAKSEFLRNHPIIQRFLGTAPMGTDKAPISGPGMMQIPGVKSAADALANKITEPSLNDAHPELKGFIGGAIQGLGGILGSGFDPRAVAPGHVTTPTDYNPDIINADFHAESVPAEETFPSLGTGESGEQILKPNEPPAPLQLPEPLPKPNLPAEFSSTEDIIPNEPAKLPINRAPEELGYDRVTANKGRGPINPIENQPTTLPDGYTVQDHQGNELSTDEAAEKGIIAKPTISNEHQELEQGLQSTGDKVLTQPDTLVNHMGVQDGFAEPKFEQDLAKSPELGQDDIPEPGKIKPDDVSAYDTQFNSVHKVLDRFDSTRDIAKTLTDAQDIKPRWLYGKFREFGDVSKGLDLGQRQQLGQLINHGTNDLAYNQANNITPDMINRANQAKSLLDDLHEFMIKMGVKGNRGETNLGYLSQYFPNTERGPEGFAEQIKDIWAHYLGKENPFYKLITTHEPGTEDKISPNVNDMYDKGTSIDPWAAFTLSRNNKMNPMDIEWDYNKVIPAYLESAAKVTFDAPAIEKAENLLKQNADQMSPRLKELATNAITNYSGYDSRPALTEKYDNLARSIANRVASSLISFNPGMHLLHLGEIPANILPGLGPQYTARGIKDFGLNIRSNFQDMARLGLLQDEVKPMQFKTPSETISSLGYFRSYAESIVKGIAYRGALAKALDEGLPHPEAVKSAIKTAKDLTLTVDKARQMQVLTPEAKGGAGGPIVRLAGQFKGIPLKYVEQQQEFIKNLADNPTAANAWSKVALSLLGAGGAGLFGREVNKKLIHIQSPTELVMGATAGPFADIMKRIINDTEMSASNLRKGNTSQAKNYLMQSLVDSVALFTPGGSQIKKLLPKDISAPGSNKGMRLKFKPMQQ